MKVLLSPMLTPGLTGCGGLSRVDPLRVVTSGRDGWRHPQSFQVFLPGG